MHDFTNKIFIAIISFIVVGCKNIKPRITDNAGTTRRIILMTDTTGNSAAQVEYDIYVLKKLLCKRLSLYDLETSSDSLEIRFWIEPALYLPSQLYILKIVDTSCSLFHYILYQRDFDSNKDDYRTWDGYKNPKFDSIKVETLRPLNLSWQNYIAQLNIDSLWNFPSQSALKGSFGGLDGVSYSLELADKGRYKFIHYDNPMLYVDKEINHKYFMDFENKLIGPISHRGMLTH